MRVAYLGPHKDYSGYGEANRHFLAALDAAGVDVRAQMVTYTRESADFGAIGQIVDRLLANDFEYRIKIVHLTPDQYEHFYEHGKYHIGHFFWETDLVPEEFANGLKLMDEIWTGSHANVAAIRKAGVNVPVYVFPQPIETERKPVDKYLIKGLPDNAYIFYSIFEWHDRKNPAALLEAYAREFGPKDSVALLIKTYFGNFSTGNKNSVKSAAQSLIERMGGGNLPPTYLYLDLMDRNQIDRFHETGDCFVSATRGEGWGVPQVEAAIHGKPIITPGYGGVAEYFQDGVNAHILPFTMVPVKGMSHSKWYTPDQNWAMIDVDDLQQRMRSCYEDRKSTAKMAAAGHKMVVDNFNFKTVGKAMAARLKQIEEEL